MTTKPEDDHRGTGRTTAQMKAAPEGAVYVWCSKYSLDYPRQLSTDIGRSDLMIIAPEQIENLRGTRCNIVIDHDAKLTEDQKTFIAAYFNGT